MNKPIIAIFCKGNLPTKEEQKIIDGLSVYPCVILNAETYTPQESLIVDAVIGVVPVHLSSLPKPDEVIKKYQAYLAGTGDSVGGNPPQPPKEEDPPQDPPKQDKLPKNTGFGNPPQPPKDK